MIFPPPSLIGGTARPAARWTPLLPGSPFGRHLARELARLRGDPAHPAGMALELSADIVAALSRTTILPDRGEDRRVRAARERLDDWMDPRLDVSKLGRDVGLHPSYLAGLFRQTYGLTPYAYWQAARIERARQHLRAGAKAGQLAHRLGFADQSHFTRTFRRAVGVPPSTYQAGFPSVGSSRVSGLEKF
jgi:AraC-like DNA-binding protein